MKTIISILMLFTALSFAQAQTAADTAKKEVEALQIRNDTLTVKINKFCSKAKLAKRQYIKGTDHSVMKATKAKTLVPKYEEDHNLAVQVLKELTALEDSVKSHEALLSKLDKKLRKLKVSKEDASIQQIIFIHSNNEKNEHNLKEARFNYQDLEKESAQQLKKMKELAAKEK